MFSSAKLLILKLIGQLIFKMVIMAVRAVVCNPNSGFERLECSSALIMLPSLLVDIRSADSAGYQVDTTNWMQRAQFGRFVELVGKKVST